MKTKKLFLMAAMLLMSMCMFAQNNTPLKGDVNEDGTVDVADLVAVMQIMKDAGGAVGEKMCYWYAGVNGGNAVTEANFTDVASKIAESQIPETGFVTATDQYVFFVMPETRFISSLTDANGNAVNYDCTDAYGYHIYKTQEKYSGKLNYGIAERIFYWYLGSELQTAVNNPSIWRTTNKDAGFTVTVSLPIGETWFIFPDSWEYHAKETYGDSFAFNAFVNNTIKNSIPGYTIERMVLHGEDDITITFSKKNINN